MFASMTLLLAFRAIVEGIEILRGIYTTGRIMVELNYLQWQVYEDAFQNTLLEEKKSGHRKKN